MSRVVHVPYTVEPDKDRVWCAHAQIGPNNGANGHGPTEEAALADLREALLLVFEEDGTPHPDHSPAH